ILLRIITGLLPFSNTLRECRARTCYQRGHGGSVFVTNVNDWSLATRLTEQWSQPRTELESRIRPDPVAYKCEKADARKLVRRRYTRNGVSSCLQHDRCSADRPSPGRPSNPVAVPYRARGIAPIR